MKEEARLYLSLSKNIFWESFDTFSVFEFNKEGNRIQPKFSDNYIIEHLHTFEYLKIKFPINICIVRFYQK